MIEPEPLVPLPSIPYRQALADTQRKRKHLLLGNGFSMAFDRQMFSWSSLAAAAGDPPEALRSLLREKSDDIEAALSVLVERHASALACGDDDAALQSSRQIERLKEHLIRGVTAVQDSSRLPTTDHKRQCCEFLRPFIGRNAVPQGVVFTTNYDLLLYWTLVQHMRKRSHGELRLEDSFFSEYWQPNRMDHVDMSVVYLHGALHLYSHRGMIKKTIYQNGPIPMRIVAQVRVKIEQNDFPIFVSEGSRYRKKERIDGNPYLSAAFRKFKATCKQPDSVLFIVGQRLAEQDGHLSDLIGAGRIPEVYFGAYGGAGSEDGMRAA